MGYLYAVLSVLFWSLNVIVGRYLIGVISPWQIAFLRWFIAAIILFPITIKGIIFYRVDLWKSRQMIFGASLIGFTFCNTFVYYASYSLSAIEMSLFSVTGPIFLILFSRFWGGIILNSKQKKGFFITILGLILVILHGRIETLSTIHLSVGDFWMLMMAMTFGLYSFIMTKRDVKIPQLVLLSVMIILGTVMILPMFIYDWIIYPTTHIQMFRHDVLWIMLYMGIFNSILAYLFWNKALDKIGGIKSGMIYYLMPVFSTIFAFLFLGERVYTSQIYGGIIILFGIFLVNSTNRKEGNIERP